MIPPDPAWGHAEWVVYFQGDLTNSVQHDVRPLIQSGGLFGVPRQFFPYVEYLSGLVFGPARAGTLGTTSHARDFLMQFMNRVDPLYGLHAQLLIHMWRHGLIHTYKPKMLQAASGRLIGWSSYVGPRTNATGGTITLSHLTPYINSRENHDLFPVSINCLVDDLEQVIHLIASDLQNEQTTGGGALLNNMRAAAQLIAQPVSVDFTW
jgi:hypothetical protein